LVFLDDPAGDRVDHRKLLGRDAERRHYQRDGEPDNDISHREVLQNLNLGVALGRTLVQSNCRPGRRLAAPPRMSSQSPNAAACDRRTFMSAALTGTLLPRVSLAAQFTPSPVF